MSILFRNTIAIKILLALAFILPGFAQNDLPVNGHPATDLTSDWKLGMQLWTFKDLTFMEALEKTASLGLSWVEAYPGQKFSPDDRETVFDHNLPEVYRNIVKKRLNELGLRLVNYGVVSMPAEEAEAEKIFKFAQDMGIETLNSEPEADLLPMVDALCRKYNLRVALHNHPKPSRYWSPDTVMKVLQGVSPAIGVCGDIGHWMRSGLHPLDAIRKLDGRIITIHLKDLKDFGRPAEKDVPVGRGASDIDLVLQELRRQNFKGVFSLEHENNWDDNLPYLRQSITNFNLVAGYFKRPEWFTVLDPKLSRFDFEPGTWELQEDILKANGGGEIWSKQKFGNFILDLQFRIEQDGNSGVFLRTGNTREWLHTAIEVQIFDSYGRKEMEKWDCGAIFDCLEPSLNAVNRPGEWNRYTITCLDNKIYVVLNGHQVINMDLDRWTTPHLNPDGTENKFNTAYKDMPRVGNFGLQYHGDPVEFRNIKIKLL